MKTGFIGCGNMGGALIAANAKKMEKDSVLIFDRNPGKVKALCEKSGAVSSSLPDICADAKYIFLGVKPQGMAAMLENARNTLSGRKDRFILVTMAAGLTIASIRGMAGVDCPVIRIMPNLAAAVGESMTLWCSEGTTSEENAEFLDIMQESGRFMQLDEKLIDAGSAISGCGPAYVYMFIEALSDGGVRCGLKRAAALELAAQTLVGAAKLMQETGRHPEEIKDAVCSPGGTTIAGVLKLEEKGFRAASSQAVIAAYDRTIELKK